MVRSARSVRRSASGSEIRSGVRRGQRGFTMVELVVVAAILTILAAATVPLAYHTHKRVKEIELRTALRDMRYAIDEYKRYSDAGLIPVDLGTDGYPSDLENLVDGVDVIGQVNKKVRFLRRIPVDLMTGTAEWGKRSYQDDPDTDSWGGENVYDVHSLSEGVGLNGIPYSQW